MVLITFMHFSPKVEIPQIQTVKILIVKKWHTIKNVKINIK